MKIIMFSNVSLSLSPLLLSLYLVISLLPLSLSLSFYSYLSLSLSTSLHLSVSLSKSLPLSIFEISPFFDCCICFKLSLPSVSLYFSPWVSLSHPRPVCLCLAANVSVRLSLLLYWAFNLHDYVYF